MILKKQGNSSRDGEKRHYMPYSVKYDCRSCGKQIEHDFNSDYFSYPPLEKKFKHTMYYDCDCGCENKTEVEFIIKETLELVLPSEKQRGKKE